jgi:hypothetical protein
MTTQITPSKDLVFNTPFETGIRSVVVLICQFPNKLTIPEILLLDYLVVHTSDVGGPQSLHPPEDFRTAEMLVRRDLVRTGLHLMARKHLIEIEASEHGFVYSAGEEAGSFVDLLVGPYASELKLRAAWLCETENQNGKGTLERLLKESKGLWLPEFQAGSAN